MRMRVRVRMDGSGKRRSQHRRFASPIAVALTAVEAGPMRVRRLLGDA